MDKAATLDVIRDTGIIAIIRGGQLRPTGSRPPTPSTRAECAPSR